MRNPPKKADGTLLIPAAVKANLNRVRRGDDDVELVTETRTYRLITPLFGGGVDAGEADPVTVIRGSSIRGQLRFWWRACRGGQWDGSLQKMKEAEDRLWGAASTEKKPCPSKVQIAVSITQEGISVKPFQMVQDPPDAQGRRRVRLQRNENVAHSYGAFPLQPTEGDQRRYRMETPIKLLQAGIEFTLTFTYPAEDKAEVHGALWAWETFGGIGARTRRGFGALSRTDNGAPKTTKSAKDAIKAYVQKGLKENVVNGKWHKDVPHLTQSLEFTVTSPANTAADAWKYLLKRLKEFRQQRTGHGPMNPGRSRWPEPDAVRDMTHQALPNHSVRVTSFNKFPRAAFGLPIIFHFKDSNNNNVPLDPHSDPVATTLQGKDHDRLASPLLLRPLECGDGKSVGLAVVLEAPMVTPHALILKDAPGNPVADPILTKAEASSLPMLTSAAAATPFDGQKVVLKAFLLFL